MRQPPKAKEKSAIRQTRFPCAYTFSARSAFPFPYVFETTCGCRLGALAYHFTELRVGRGPEGCKRVTSQLAPQCADPTRYPTHPNHLQLRCDSAVKSPGKALEIE